MYTTKAQICIRRDTAANFTSANPTLALGEIAYETDTRNIKVGTGSTAWTALGYINPYRGGTAAADTTNTVLGNSAGASMQSGATYNTCIGGNSGNAITTADYNVFVGAQSGTATSTGSQNVAVGYAAYQVGDGTSNTAVGMLSQLTATSGADNTSVGAGSLQSNLVGNSNVAVGASALSLNTASNITAVGANALDANTTATGNTAVGKDSLGATTTGVNNVAIGNNAASANTTGSSLVAIGFNALQNTTGGINIGIGQSAGSGITGGIANIAIGRSALQSVQSDNYNVGVGDFVLESCVGSSNTAVGFQAGRYINSGAALTSASNSIMIGSEARFNGNGETNQIVIAGTAGRGNGSNTTTIGNSSTTGTFIPAGDLILSGSTQQVLVGTATAPADDIKLQVQRDADAKIAVVSPISGGVANASVNLNASTQGSWVIQAGSAASAGLRFYDVNAGGGGSERIRFDASGNIDLKAGNVIVTSGKGIDFSATSDGTGTMTSELLSDYEEGTWTPVIRGATTAGTYELTASARYNKIGRVVTVWADLSTAAVVTGGGAGSLEIAGLPFGAGNMQFGPFALMHVGMAASKDYSTVTAIANTATLLVVCYGTDGTQDFPAVTIVGASDFMRFCATYTV